MKKEKSVLLKSCKQYLQLYNIEINNSLEQDNAVWLYSYSENFDRLWQWLDSTSVILPKTVIIIWDSIPEQKNTQVSTEKFLTPLDWAIAATLKYPDNPVPVVIFHAMSPPYQNKKKMIKMPETDSVRYFYQFPNAQVSSLPWIRLVDDSLQLALAVIKLQSFKFTNSNKQVNDLNLIRQIWTSFILSQKSGDHHALANLIGPILLSNSQGDSHVEALQTLFTCLGLISKNKTGQLLSKTNAWINWDKNFKWKNRLETLDVENLHLVLLDDHLFDQGWGEILCKAVGVSYLTQPEFIHIDNPINMGYKEITNESSGKITSLKVDGSSSVGWLIKKIILLEKNNSERFQFKLLEHNNFATDSEILLLDLRLFSKNSNDEKKFFQLIIGAIRNLKFDERANQLPWNSFTKSEISEAEKWLEQTSTQDESDVYHRLLTFFPRLLALIDPSMPIILFSSTGRREITDCLNQYGNIITCFEKPRFFSSTDSDIVKNTQVKFCEAMEKAMQIAAGRKILNQLSLYETKEEKLISSKKEGKYSIALYLDETENIKNKKFTVGGILAIYPPGLFPEKITSSKKTWKLWRNIISEADLKDKSYLRKNKKNIEKKILEVATNDNIFIAAVAAVGRLNRASPSLSPLINETLIDNQYRELFRVVVESAIYGLARKKLPTDAKADIYIVAGTRIVPLKNFIKVDPDKEIDKAEYGEFEKEERKNQKSKLIHQLKNHWGLFPKYSSFNHSNNCLDCWNAKYHLEKIIVSNNASEQIKTNAQNLLDEIDRTQEEPDQGIVFIAHDSIRPLVDEIMRHYDEEQLCVQSACAHNLSDYKKSPFLHLFADAAIQSFDSKPSREWRKTSETWQNGFAIHKTHQTQLFIQAQRYMLRELPVEALLCGAMALNQSTLNKDYEHNIFSDLYKMLSALKGEDIIKFCLSYRKTSMSHDVYGVVTSILYRKNRFKMQDESGNVWSVINNSSDKLHVGDNVILKNICPEGINIDPTKPLKVTASVHLQ